MNIPKVGEMVFINPQVIDINNKYFVNGKTNFYIPERIKYEKVYFSAYKDGRVYLAYKTMFFNIAINPNGTVKHDDLEFKKYDGIKMFADPNERKLGDSICPICSSSGVNLIFKFYCSNPSCQNFKSE